MMFQIIGFVISLIASPMCAVLVSRFYQRRQRGSLGDIAARCVDVLDGELVTVDNPARLCSSLSDLRTVCLHVDGSCDRYTDSLSFMSSVSYDIADATHDYPMEKIAGLCLQASLMTDPKCYDIVLFAIQCAILGAVYSNVDMVNASKFVDVMVR